MLGSSGIGALGSTKTMSKSEEEKLKNALPQWLDDMRSDLMSSPEWQNLTTVVYHSVQDRLKQNHIQFFSDLNDIEKTLFIDEVERSLANDSIYKGFQGVLSRSLDESLSNKVEEELLTSGSSRENKVTMILDRAAEGATKLLRRLPNEKSTLRIMLNHELPGPLRRQAWGMFLGHPEARKKFDRDFLQSRMSTISEHDADISSKCQVMIDTKFCEIDGHRTGTLISLMKTTLSYYEVLTQRDLDDTYYYLAIPLSYVWCSTFTESAAVIEAFIALMEMPRPKYMSSVMDVLSATLKTHDGDLYEHIAQINATSTTSISGVTTDTFLANLLKNVVLRMFVGTLSMPVCCYVWDQGLLLGSFEKVIPNFAVTLMVVLRENLLASPTPAQLQRTIDVHSQTVELRNFQGVAERLFMDNVRTKLGLKRDFAGDLFEAVDYENRQFDRGVPGLDGSMDWDSFALASSGSPRSPVRRRANNIQLLPQPQAVSPSAKGRGTSSNAYKVEDNLTTKKRFDDHMSAKAKRREEKEAAKMKKRRKHAVEDAEEALAIAEEERDQERHMTNLAQKKALQARREQFAAHRREREMELRMTEAAERKLKDELQGKALEDERKRINDASMYDEHAVSEMERQKQDLEDRKAEARGDNFVVQKKKYLGAPNAPNMKLKLKRSDGTEHKISIKALVMGDTEEDARFRVQHALEEEGIGIDRTPKILKALYTFSKQKTNYKADWTPSNQSSAKSSRTMTPNRSGRNTPVRDPNSVDTHVYTFTFHAVDLGLKFQEDRRSPGAIGCLVKTIKPTSEGMKNFMVWQGDKITGVGDSDVSSFDLETLTTTLKDVKRPVTLKFTKHKPFLGAANTPSFPLSLRDAHKKKVKINIKAMVAPEHDGDAQHRAVWVSLITGAGEGNIPKVYQSIVDFTKKRGYKVPPAPEPEPEVEVYADPKMNFGEYDVIFEEQKLGMILDHVEGSKDVVVKKIAPGSFAAKCGEIAIGDVIVMIHRSNVLGQTTADVKDFLVKQDRPIRFRFRKQFKSREDEEKAKKKAEEDAKKKANLDEARKVAEEKAKAAGEQYELEKDEDGQILFNGHTPLVAATLAVIEGLNLIAFGEQDEQELIHEQIKEEDEGIKADWDVAVKKHWGAPLSETQIAGFSAAQQTRYNKMKPKMMKTATANYKKRMKAIKKKH